MPIRESLGVTSIKKMAASANRGIPGSVITSGIIWCLRSIKVMTIRAHVNTKRKEVLEGQTIFSEEKERYYSGQQFYCGIDRGYSFIAIPAFPPEYNVADNRYIVIDLYGMFTDRTVGRGEHDRFSRGNSVDTYVEKTPHDGSQNY